MNKNHATIKGRIKEAVFDRVGGPSFGKRESALAAITIAVLGVQAIVILVAAVPGFELFRWMFEVGGWYNTIGERYSESPFTSAIWLLWPVAWLLFALSLFVDTGRLMDRLRMIGVETYEDADEPGRVSYSSEDVRGSFGPRRWRRFCDWSHRGSPHHRIDGELGPMIMKSDVERFLREDRRRFLI